jgi:hypothetical protein
MLAFIKENADVEQDLVALSRASIEQLRQRWVTEVGTDPPAAFGPDLLRRGIPRSRPI